MKTIKQTKKISFLLLIVLTVSLILSSCATTDAGRKDISKNDTSQKETSQKDVSQKDTAQKDTAQKDVAISGGDEPMPTEVTTEVTTEETVNMQAPSSMNRRDFAGEYNHNISGESYLNIKENAATDTDEESVITFSLKVDTASYSNIQRYLDNGELPPADAVRTEELINYFSYDTPLKPAKGVPFGIYTEVAPSPFSANKHLLFARIKTEDIPKKNLPSSNLTFLIDTSGSMYSYDKLTLLKEAFSLLVENLDDNDRVSIVTYAGSSEVVLASARGNEKDRILKAIHALEAGGSTAGAEGINTAYELAKENFIKNGNNRVILATDGDFNVGISNTDDLSKLIIKQKDAGVYLSILGFGTGNLREDIMETLSKDGNGNYNYIYNVATAQKVLVEELASNLFTVADDVKAQIEFNPANVLNYRLLGYENRRLNNEDFEDDTKDAGEIGMGTDVVMLFEVELGTGGQSGQLKYGSESSTVADSSAFSNELCEVRIRYKNPGESKSELVLHPVALDDITNNPSSDLSFASSVAIFSHILRDSEHTGDATLENALELAVDNQGTDSGGYRKNFLGLLETYKRITR